jgi:hypothetical protein
MAVGAASPFRSDVGCVGAHVSLLAATVGLASYLIGLSAVIVMIDLFILRSALKGAARDRIVSLLMPAAFLSVALFILLANPL